MNSDYLATPLIFLVQVLFGLYTLAVLLRFLLQWVRADFYNPLSQFLVRITTPVLHPMRRYIPGVRGLDTSALVLAWLLKSLETLLVLLIKTGSLPILLSLLLAIPQLLELFLDIFLFAVFIQVILSWLAPGGYHPGISLLHSLTEPLMSPARRILPAISGIDLSPMLVILGLYLSKMLLIPPVNAAVTGLYGFLGGG